MRTEKYLLPSWVLCPLFNSDLTGTTEEEDAALDAFLEREGAKYETFHAVSATEDGFRPSNDLDRLGGDCHVVTFAVKL